MLPRILMQATLWHNFTDGGEPHGIIVHVMPGKCDRCHWNEVESLDRRSEVLTKGKQRDISYSPSVAEIWREGRCWHFALSFALGWDPGIARQSQERSSVFVHF